jgi:hypothetical protein
MAAQDSLHSLLDYECLLFCCDWLGSDLWVGHFFTFCCPLVNTPQLNTELSYDWITELPSERRIKSFYEWTIFYNSGRTEYKLPCLTVSLLFFLSVATGMCAWQAVD